MAPGYDTFLECCGSKTFASCMVESHPFASLDEAVEKSRLVWWNEVSIPGWLEAFAAHPRIGDLESLKKKFTTGKQLAAGEQSTALNTAAQGELQDLAEWNRKYEAKFGFVFLICASGKSALEVLTALKTRFPNRPLDEIKLAAAEQQKITEIRLGNLNAWPSRSGGESTASSTNAKGVAPPSRPPVTTHVLDVSLGAPGVGIDVMLEFSKPSTTAVDASSDPLSSFTGDSPWTVLGSSVTNSDGRAGALMGNSDHLEPGRYRLTFKTGEYFLKGSKSKDGIRGFYPYVCLIFDVKPSQVSEHFHVPLLISPYSFTTYRGS